MIFVKSGLLNGGYSFTLKNYNRSANEIRISRTEYCEMYKQRVDASRELGAERKLLSSSVVDRMTVMERERFGEQEYCYCVVILRRETRRGWY